MDYVALGKKLRIYRKREHMTLKQLSEKTRLSHSFLCHVELGGRKASLETLERVCGALEIGLADLFSDQIAPAATTECFDLIRIALDKIESEWHARETPAQPEPETDELEPAEGA